MRRLPFLAVVCCAVTIGGCMKESPKVAETAKGEITPQPAPVATLTFADLAGKWNVNAIPEWNDTLVTHVVINATPDSTGWTIVYPPNPTPIKASKVTLSGDSVILDWGPYMSARRKGMKALSHDIYHLRDGKLVGYSSSHYVGAPADSTLKLRLEGTRAP